MIIEGVLGICGVCVNEKFSGEKHGRIFRIVNVNSEISALFRRISPCVRFVEDR